MAGDAAEHLFTIESFLDWQGGEAGRRYELVDGRIVAMAPGTEGHTTLVPRICAQLLAQLKPPCRPMTEVGIRAVHSDASFYVADIAVTCSPPDRHRRWMVDPILIVEVLSPSTFSHDRGQKVPDYMAIPSVMEILLVETDRNRAQLWSRQSDGWFVRDFIGDAEVPLACLGGSLRLDDLYAGL